MTSFSAIIPKEYTSAAKAAKLLDKLLLTFQVEATRQLKKYPAQQPTPYRRTGDLGRGWGGYTLKSTESIEMTNATRYAVWVQGPTTKSPGQARRMAAKGWPSVTLVGEDAMRIALVKTKLNPKA